MECEFGVTLCEQNKECVLAIGSKARNGVCKCKNGFTEDIAGKCVEVSYKGHKELPGECEYGVTLCGPNKECVLPTGTKARNGVCMCEKGFLEDSSGKCLDKLPVTSQTVGSGLGKNLAEKTATPDGSPGDKEVISTTTFTASTGKGTTATTPIPETKKNTTPSGSFS